MQSRHRRRAVETAVLALALSLAASLLLAAHARAAAVVWTGMGSTENAPWSDTGNWAGNVAPVNGDTVLFPAGASSLLTTDDIPGLQLAGLTFSGAYQMYGQDLALTGPIAVGASAGQVVIGDNLILRAPTVDITNSDPGVSQALLITGDISEAGGARALHVFGPGVVDLAGNDSNTGVTTVDGPTTGILFIDGNSPSSNIAIHAGATLGGNGAGGNVTDTGGTVAPGHSPGHLTINSLSLNPTSTLSIELDGTAAGSQYDQVTSLGAVSLGSANLMLTLGFTPATGDSFTIIDNAGSGAVSGTFGGLPEGAEFSTGGRRFGITYAGGSGNDVVLTAISGFTSTTTLASSPNPSDPGQTVTFSAHVSAGLGTPTGTVTFLDGSAVLSIVALDASNNASLATASLSSGSHQITARYNGDATFNGSAAALTQVVNGEAPPVPTTVPVPSTGTPIPLVGTLLAGIGAILIWAARGRRERRTPFC